MNEPRTGNDMENMNLGGKYLTFLLADECYGVQILKVREIIGLTDSTRVPGTPDFVRGVINLRGKVIPVIDLKERLGLGRTEDTEYTCIIIMDFESDDRTVQVGMVVDTVFEVIDIPANIIEPAPGFGVSDRAKYIGGLARTECGVRILLDIDNVLDPADFSGTGESTVEGEKVEGVTQ